MAVVPEARDAEVVEAVVGEFKRQTSHELIRFEYIDNCPVYAMVVLNAFGKEVTTTATVRVNYRKVSGKLPLLGSN